MTRESSGPVQPPAIRRTLFGAAAAVPVILAAAVAIAAENTPRITIPPAKLPLPRAAPETIAAAPQQPPPPLLHPRPDTQGSGMVLKGALTGEVGSAAGAVLALLARSTDFDAPPMVQLTLSDVDDRHAQALFTASANGAPMVGVAVAVLRPSSGDVALLYDRAGAFALSFPRLRQLLAADAAVAIGIADNSAAEGETADAANADPGWTPIIAARATGGEAPIESALAQALAASLTSDTGVPWRPVPLAALR